MQCTDQIIPRIVEKTPGIPVQLSSNVRTDIAERIHITMPSYYKGRRLRAASIHYKALPVTPIRKGISGADQP